MNRASALLISLLGLTVSLGADGSPLDANAPGDVAVRVAVSPTPEFLRRWLATPFEAPVAIKRLHEMTIGETAYVGIIATGYTRNERGSLSLEVDLKIVNPDGTVLFTLPKYARVEGSGVPRGFVMLDPALDFVTEPGDQVGRYHIEALLRDKVSGKSVKGAHSFIVNPERITSAFNGRAPGSV